MFYYRPHPKDGEGNVFTLSTPGGGDQVQPTGGGVRSVSRRGGGGGQSAGGGGQDLAPSCGRYASCVHAGGLPCLQICIVFASH